MTLLLWVASHVFKGISYKSAGALWVAALLLGLVNAVVRPILVFFTLPLTLLTMGLFLLVVNALSFGIAAWLVPGFSVNGFVPALLGSIVMAILSFVFSMFIHVGDEKKKA